MLLLELLCRALRRRLGRAGALGLLLAALLGAYVETPQATARIAATEQRAVEIATQSLTQAIGSSVTTATSEKRDRR